MKVTQANANGANRQRILNCNRPTTLPITYANDVERRRIEKYEAAAELQESPAESAIYKDCNTNNGCRSNTAITVNGRSYYASYGRTQFIAETFLSTLRELIPNLTAQERQQLGLNQSAVLPNGTAGTMADMVTIARQRSEKTAIAYRNNRVRLGRGLPADQATAAWNALSPGERNQFIVDTGLGQNEFIDMLGYQPSGRARTEAEGQNAFGTEAAMRLLDGNGRPVFGAWLMDLFKSQDNYYFISKRFLQNNLKDVLKVKQLESQFANAETPNTPTYQTRQREIEENLASRVAALHNWGNVARATAPTMNLPRFVQDYVNEFVGITGRGDWWSLRCTNDSAGMRGLPGLQLTPLGL